MQSELNVRLEIVGESFSPDEITKFLGIKPTWTYKKGDLKPNTDFKYKTNLWELQSQIPKSQERDPLEALDSHLTYIFSKIDPISEKLREITNKHDTALSLTVYCSDSTPALFFEKNVLAKISALGISLEIDIILLEP